MKKVCIIANPVAGRRASGKVEKAAEQLEAAGADIEIRYTAAPADAIRLAREAVNQRFDVIVAAGGDGTVSDVVNGMAGSSIPMAVLPVGTVNLMARELGTYGQNDLALETILSGDPWRINLGQAGDRFFLLVAGIGFDARVIRDVNLKTKSFIGKLAYILTGFKLIAKSPLKSVIEYSVDDAPPLKCSSLILGNAKYYGGNFKVTPGAALDKPDLELCAFEGKSRLSILRYGLGVLIGKHTQFSDVTIRTVRKVSIKSDNLIYVQVDGDYLCPLPLEFSIVPDSLTVLRPSRQSASVS